MNYAIGFTLVWGFFPLYLHVLAGIPPLEIVLHRVIWSAVFLSIFVMGRKPKRAVTLILELRPQWKTLLASSLLIGSNWGLYVYSVVNNHAVEASLGYFISPLMLLGLGAVFLQERLVGMQPLAVALTVLGVLVLVIRQGHVPWYALYLALSFSIYALIRRKAAIRPIIGTFVETTALIPVFFLIWSLWSSANPEAAIQPKTTLQIVFLLFSGVVSATPMIWFIEASKRIPMKTLGIVGYLSPTLQFLSAVFGIGEPFTLIQLPGFALIWTGVLVYFWTLLRRE